MFSSEKWDSQASSREKEGRVSTAVCPLWLVVISTLQNGINWSYLFERGAREVGEEVKLDTGKDL